MISRSFLLFSLIAIVLNVIATDLGEVATCFASFADSESPSPKPRIPNISYDQGLIRIDNLLNDEEIENLVKLESCMSMIRKSNAPHVNEVISTVLPELTDYLNMSIISATKTTNWRQVKFLFALMACICVTVTLHLNKNYYIVKAIDFQQRFQHRRDPASSGPRYIFTS